MLAGRPGLIVAGRLRPPATGKRRTGRAIGIRRAREIRLVRLFPLARLVVELGRRHVDDVMHPAVPARRNAACLGKPIIDHPAPLEAERRVDLSAAGAVVAVALLVLADQLAVPAGPELGAKGLAIPPGEELEKELFHAARALLREP